MDLGYHGSYTTTTTVIGEVCVVDSFLGSFGAGRVFVKPDV